MLLVVVPHPDQKAAAVAGRLLEDGDEVADDRLSRVVDLGLSGRALHLGEAAYLQGEADPAAAGPVGGEAVHVQDGEVDPPRRRHPHLPLPGGEGPATDPQGLDLLAGGEGAELVLHQVQVPAPDLQLGHVRGLRAHLPIIELPLAIFS